MFRPELFSGLFSAFYFKADRQRLPARDGFCSVAVSKPGSKKVASVLLVGIHWVNKQVGIYFETSGVLF